MEMVFYCVDCGKFFYGASDKEHNCRHCGSSKTAITQMSERRYADMCDSDKTAFKRQIRAAYAPENMTDQSELYCKKCGKFVGIHTELCVNCQRVEAALRERIVRQDVVFYCVDCGKFFYGTSDEEHTCPHCSSSKTVTTQMPKQRYSGLDDEAKAGFKRRIRTAYTPESMKDQPEMCCKKCGKFIGLNAELCIDCQKEEVVQDASTVKPPVRISLSNAIASVVMPIFAYLATLMAIAAWGFLVLALALVVLGLIFGIQSISRFNKTSSVRSGARIPLLILGIVGTVENSMMLLYYLVAIVTILGILS